MLKILWKAIGPAPVVLAAVSVLTNTVYADEVPVVKTAPEPMTTAADQANPTLEIDRGTEETDPLSQITPVFQLKGATEQPNPSLEPIERETEETNPLSQVTSVWELSDIQPTDWAFQALQFLADHYNCLAAYPDGTNRGDRELTRYEFAVSLNACFLKLRDTVAIKNLATVEDLATLQRLLEEFATELEAVEGRIDNLEHQETIQFSTTTKLDGDVTLKG